MDINLYLFPLCLWAGYQEMGGEPVKKISPEKGYLLVSSLGAWMTHLMGPYLTIWLRSLGISFAQIGFFQSVSSLLTFITDFPTGGLADRYGRRLNYAAGILLFGVSLIIIACSSSFFIIALAFALAGIGSAFMSGTLTPWLYDAIKGDKKRAHMVFSRMRIINGILGTVAGFVAGTISRYALNLPILLAGICGISASLLALLFLEENYGHGKAKPYGEILKDGLKHIAQERTLQYLLVASFFLSFAGRSFFMFWMVLAKEAGLRESSVGYVYPLLILSTSFGGFVSLRLSRFMDHRKILAITTPLMGLLIIAMGIVKGLLSLLALITLFEIIIAIRAPAMITFRNELIPSPIRSTVTSALSTIGGMFSMLANIAVGLIADIFGLGGAYVVSGILALFASLFLTMAIKHS